MAATLVRRCAVNRQVLTIAPNVPLARRVPDRADLVVVEDAVARLRLWILPPHAAHDRRLVVVVAGREPIHDAAHDAQHAIGLPGAVIVLHVVEQRGDIAAADAEKFAVAPDRQHVAREEPFDLLVATAARWLRRAA